MARSGSRPDGRGNLYVSEWQARLVVSEAQRFRPGDEVLHPARPEWGMGVVEQATNVQHEGQPAQRLVVTFKAHGRITMNTGVSPLVGKEAAKQMSSTTTSHSRSETDWLGRPAERGSEALTRLPEAMTDPFAGPQRRLAATVQSFRFGQNPASNPRGLIEWAMSQSGLDDPLSRFTRHELEEAFGYFARARDQHLRKLVAELKREGRQDLIHQAVRETRYPAAKNLLQRALRE